MSARESGSGIPHAENLVQVIVEPLQGVDDEFHGLDVKVLRDELEIVPDLHDLRRRLVVAFGVEIVGEGMLPVDDLDPRVADAMAKPIAKLRGRRTPKSILWALDRALKKSEKDE